MKLLPISLVAKRGNWQRFRSRMRNKNFQKLNNEALTKDDYICQYCGFRSEKFQVVVNRNHDYSPNQSRGDNLATACIFCAQCFFLDGIGSDKNMGGHLVYLPEISQADLSNFCRVLFASMLRDAPYKGKLQTTYLSLKDREKVIDEVFGPESSNPHTFGQAMIDSSLTKEQLQHPILAQIRLLPDRKYFTTEIEYWKKTVFDQIPL